MNPQPAPRWPTRSPIECASTLGISQEAAELFACSDVIDLHVDSFIWVRLLGYRLDREHHGGGPLRGRFLGQVDLPRLRRAGISAATWVITTNPARTARGRERAFVANLSRLRALLSSFDGDVGLAETCADYQRLRAVGKHAAFIGIQGGSALDVSLHAWQSLLPRQVLRVTLLHLYSSRLGQTSTPLSNIQRQPMTSLGGDVVRFLNDARIFVDLAHIGRRGFFAALQAHARDLPPIVTHTGVSGAYAHWRNLDDEQIHAVAERGGVVGIMYHTPYLRPGWARGSLECIVDHIEHAIRVGGEHCVALGSDWDGAITTPRDMPTCSELPRLVFAMQRRGFSSDRIQNVLGRNFLRCLKDLRG